MSICLELSNYKVITINSNIQIYFVDICPQQMTANSGLRAGARGLVLRLRQGYGACTLL